MTEDDLSQFDFQEGEYCKVQNNLKALLSKDLQSYNDILKCIQLYTSGIINLKEFSDVVDKTFSSHGARKEKEKLLKLLASRSGSRRQLSWCCKPTSDLSQARCKRIGSYLQLPEEYPRIVSTGRDELLGKELNDHWVSVASGSEDFSFKVSRKNVYEEQLCKCENDRFEHDMGINCCEFVLASFRSMLKAIPARISASDLYFSFNCLGIMLIVDVHKEVYGANYEYSSPI